jgi:hypothetical protein
VIPYAVDFIIYLFLTRAVLPKVSSHNILKNKRKKTQKTKQELSSQFKPQQVESTYIIVLCAFTALVSPCAIHVAIYLFLL